MKIKKITLALIIILGSNSFLLAQENEKKEKFSFFHRESRKELIHQRDSLLRVIEEMKNEMMIELSDTLSVGDTINPGGIDILEDCLDTTGYSLSRDSLLSMWYKQRNLSIMEMETIDMDSTDIISDIPDSVIIDRLQKMNSFVSLPYNKIVRNHILFYTQKIPSKTETMLGLSNYYMPIFEEIFDQYNLPTELKAMAIIESALNPKAVSRVKAKGMWQFMYSTALRYNLHINSYVDERFDPIASGHAAAKYLRDAYLIFGDWALAIASYNCGAGNVNKAIRRSGGAKDFWEIYNYLPRETRGYLPSFIAALYSINYYKEHQLTPKPAPMPIHLDTLKINRMLHFEQISHFTGLSIEELRNLNPQYLHDIIPGVEREYLLRIPYNYTNKFIDNEPEIYKYKDTILFNSGVLKEIKDSPSQPEQRRVVHTVRKGQTLGHIAIKYKVKVSDIQRWNGIKSNIRIGQKIVIYTDGNGPSSSTKSTNQTSSSSKQNVSSSGGYKYYTIRKGDNLWDIAKMFPGISVNDILELNNLTRNSKIYPGMKIKIKKSN